MVCKLAILPQSLPGFENSAGTSAFEQRGSFLLCLGFRKLSSPQKNKVADYRSSISPSV
jgi:hypothetical protein